MKKIIFVITMLMGAGMVPFVCSASTDVPDHPLIQQAKQTRGPRFEYAIKNGAELHVTADKKSYYLLWLPEGYDREHLPPMIATMHGHDGWAVEDFYVWHQFLKERGYGLLAVQWWLGEGEGIKDYLLPQEIYRVIDDVFRELGVKPGHALLHGFSRGSANIYPVAAMDINLHKNYFSLFIANAGRANANYPPVQAIDRGQFGDRPFEDSHWVTYGGGKDADPDRDGIPGMRETAEWLKKYGATIDLAIEDPTGDHGGFHQHPQNTNAALDVFEKRLKDIS